jgi:predicted RNA-binding Zn-ribbon protein involved in translation (DUF1610 family)
MPIWLHRLLGTALQVIGFFGGAFVGFCVTSLLFMVLAAGQGAGPGLGSLGNLLVFVIGATCFFGGAWLGRNLSYGLFVRNVSARCPQCGGRSYLQSENARRVRYRCRSCRYVSIGESWEE